MMTRMILWLGGCLFAGPLWAAPHGAADHGTAGSASAEIGQVVQALCTKDVVLLGEDLHHASATTVAVKVQIVERLVRQCGFRGVVFESQFYDMLDVDHAMAAGTASRQQLADAIGALWSRYPQFVPLVSWLYDEARAGRVRVGGMDPQAGGIAEHFSLQRLPSVLSSVLTGERREDCEDAIGRQNRWEYDDAHPFDAAALRQLRGCLRDIRHRLQATGRHAPSELSAMAASYAAYLGFADGDSSGKRDRAMYQNFAWLRSHWPKGTRIVVWCATVHAAKSLEGVYAGIRPFGSYVHAAFGSRAAAIGFSALGGSYGNVGGHGVPHLLGATAAGSLEVRAFTGPGTHALRFVGRAQLQDMGVTSARAINYAKPYMLDWSRVLDGVIVLRKEVAARAKP
jgi:erythromycin esterase-like protein